MDSLSLQLITLKIIDGRGEAEKEFTLLLQAALQQNLAGIKHHVLCR